MSAVKVDLNFIDNLQKFGAFDISACFNCGNCTAICPLSNNVSAFPRTLIRLAQIGAKEELISSKELWMCYYCGECSETCPRQAEPGEFMASARRYAISQYEPIKISRILFTKPRLSLVLLAFLSVILGFVANWVANNSPFENDTLLFGKPYYETIHWGGIVLGSFIMLIVVISLYNMLRRILSFDPYYVPEDYRISEDPLPLVRRIRIAWKAFLMVIYSEVALQKRFEDDSLSQPWFKNRRILHLSIFWGFSGLFLATALDFLVKDTLLGEKGKIVPIYHPFRLLGIFSGALLIFGTTMILYYRLRARKTIANDRLTKYYGHSSFSDWLFLAYLWLTGITGFIVTLLLYLPESLTPSWSHWVLVIHVIIAAELLLIAPFTKFAHALYRPFALWIYEIRKLMHGERFQEKSEDAKPLEIIA